MCTPHYYNKWYPASLAQRFVTSASAHNSPAELILRCSTDEIIRHENPRELVRLARRHAPLDGLHASFGIHPDAVFVLDVDHERARPLLCECRDGGRDICDNCWLVLAGALRCYDYVMRAHFGCQHILTCFSGGRGWHMFVLDAHNIDRNTTIGWLHTLMSTASAHVASSYLKLYQLTQGKRRFNIGFVSIEQRLATTQLSRPAMTSPTACTLENAPIDRVVMQLFVNIIVPFYVHHWLPRVIGCSFSEEAGLQRIYDLMALSDGVDAQLRSACECSLKNSNGIEWKNTIHAFLLLTWLFWVPPDKNLASANHPIRLPWSSHQRSGRLSLPILVETAHQLRPRSFPPLLSDIGSPSTTGHALFNHSVLIVESVLDKYDGAPRVCMWPT